MNERCRGMLEALGWVLDLLESASGTPEGIEEVRRKILQAIELLVRGAGSDVLERLEVIR